MLSSKEGKDLQIVTSTLARKGVVVEVANATDEEDGDAALASDQPRLICILKRGEHYLHTVTCGSI